jgi:REP-associated tyrosine transposase
VRTRTQELCLTDVSLSTRQNTWSHLFLHRQHLSAERLLTDGELLCALREALQWVRAEHPFRIDAMVVLPNHFHALWTLPPNDADYSIRLGVLKRYVSQRVRHRLEESQAASRQKRRDLGLWQRRFWEHKWL